MDNTLQYNFVFLFAESDYWKAILGQELYHGENSRVYRTAFEGSLLLQKIFHYHWAYSLNTKVCMPFKFLWFKKMYQQSFTNDLPLCFVFMGGNNIRFAGGFCEYVRKMNPENRIVILHNDLISKHCSGYNYEEIRKKADLITTYDKAEAEQYGIEYFQETTYSKLIPNEVSGNYEYDVYFLGAAKDRLEKIHNTYRYLTENGIKCKFIVAGVPKEKQIQGIEYTTGISYRENLEYIVKSKCLLEIIQGGSHDITTRAIEAIAYQRLCITDCPLQLDSFFNDGQLLQYNDYTEIDIEFIKKTYLPNDYPPVIDLNPMKRLYFMQEKLEQRK